MSTRTELQQKCSDWGVYWRAPDAHGVRLSHEQAIELLQMALGVEVEIARALREGEVMGLYVDFDRTADRKWTSAEYLVKFGMFISEKTAVVNA